MYIIYDDIFLKHNTGQSHPENPLRLLSIIDKINEIYKKKIDSFNLKFEKPTIVDEKVILEIHDKNYLEKVRLLSQKLLSRPGTFYYLDPDTVVSEHTYECALFAAGACQKGIDLIFKNPGENFFAMVRPPGHHAFNDRGSGFCIFNNIAIAAKYAINNYNLERVAIIDFDVHHGNGTQDIFYESNNVFYISMHQYPHYPGSGYYTEIGNKEGKGFNLNIPLTPFSEEVDYLFAFIELVLPALLKYKPQLLLVSAGYDAHEDDYLSSINLSSSSYYKIASLINIINYITTDISNNFNKDNLKRDNYEKNRKDFKEDKISTVNKKITNLKKLGIGLILEGGYNLRSLSESVVKTIEGIEIFNSEIELKNAELDKFDKFDEFDRLDKLDIFKGNLKDIFLTNLSGGFSPNKQNKATFDEIKKIFLL